jgi:hypothetical protein
VLQFAHLCYQAHKAKILLRFLKKSKTEPPSDPTISVYISTKGKARSLRETHKFVAEFNHNSQKMEVMEMPINE